MAKPCAKCCDAITGFDYVICRGYCGGVFHMNNCTNVTRALSSYFTTHKRNLFWMCDSCADLFENSHFRTISAKADAQSPLASLTTAITELRTEIKHLNAKPTAQAPTPGNNRWPPLEMRRATKRPRDIETVGLPSEQCRIGSKQASENVVTVPMCSDSTDKKFWLYLSRIRPDVTNEMICAMVKENLAMDDEPDVVKLVSKGKDISTLSFISFKIGLDPSMKTPAMDPTNWPEGLLFREFEDYGIPKFRMPLKTRKPNTPLILPQNPSSPATPVMDLS